MKKEWIWLIALSLCVVIIIPWSVLRWQKEKGITNDVLIRVLQSNGKVASLPLEEYLVGVVAAEMPAEFELEALKAQAVAARTYAVKQYSKRTVSDKGYDVDTTVQTQAWLSNTQMRDKWGLMKYWQYRGKLQKAVNETRGLVLVTNGEYIDAFYHSSSGRKPTERSEDVWSSPRSYLQNVSSGEMNLQRYVKNYSFSKDELSKKLGIPNGSHSLSGGDFQILTKTQAGRAKTLRVLGKVFEATQLRVQLGLTSTDIEAAIQGDKLILTVYGNGHAVGMSQWGANDLAKETYSFEKILTHYYPGTKIMRIGHN